MFATMRRCPLCGRARSRRAPLRTRTRCAITRPDDVAEVVLGTFENLRAHDSGVADVRSIEQFYRKTPETRRCVCVQRPLMPCAGLFDR